MKTNKMPGISKRTLAISFAVFVLLLPLGYGAWSDFRYKDTAFPGTELVGRRYTGLSQSQAEESFRREVAETYKDGMLLAYQDKSYRIPLAELGYEIDVNASVGQVFAYAHGSNLSESVRQQLTLLSGPVHFKSRLYRKGDLIEEKRWKEISAIEAPAHDFSYEYEAGNFVPVAAKTGFVINQDKLEQAIRDNLSDLKNDPITLELVKKEPVLVEDQGQAGLQRAKNLLKRQVRLTYGADFWDVPQEDFGKWISLAAEADEDGLTTLVPVADTAKIGQYLVAITPQISRAPVNASLEFKDGKVSVFSLSQDGVELDVEKSAERIAKTAFAKANFLAAAAAESGQKSAPASAQPIQVELAVKNVAPKITTENIDNLGLTKLLSTGESDFHGSTKSRIHNVTVGAAKFNGVLIDPGATFSFNEILGEVGPNEGYLPELVIKQGKTIAEYGGGLCQVSTTAFRGAVAAGLEVTERSNHAYAVKYYAPQGTDATIYPPHPDLAFVNNTPNYILLQTHISGTKLYFDFYGTDDGRKVETEGPVIYERGAGGAMKTWWKQRAYDKEGKLFLEKTFYSNYKPASLYPTTNPLE